MEEKMSNKALTKPFNNLETAAFCDQMAMILHSGISTYEGLTVMLEDVSDQAEKDILQKMLDRLYETGNFAEAVKAPGVFPEYMVNMVTIGEETGKLDEVMAQLATHYEREESLRKSISNTITYPVIMIGMMVVVILVLLIKVMPVFDQVFRQLGSEMTGLGKALVGMGSALSKYSVVFAVILAVIAILAVYAAKTENGRKKAVSFGYKFASIRDIIDKTSLCRFAGAMSLTLSSGLSPHRSLELVSGLITEPNFKKKFDDCMAKVDEGENFIDALHDTGIFSGMYARLVSIGQKTGEIDKSMEKVSDMCREDVDTKLGNLLAILEPTMVVIISLIVGAILLAVMLPLTGIMSAI